ncbi:holo-ACP synthase [Agriterribacter sp.]|uniref:holo-ACP synthase n=1 Tax=Agriterribacter sp. TaxID=2821509 RepID=UPI002B708C16|nr:holo-ACP synthase [Agriterribacter sp.]HTN08454.1 holo-ACP synthase [Agriterribacter sp.]
MITGIGTDIVETGRIAKAIEKEQGFRELVFSNIEIAYCESKANKYEHYAARFAAKEAFFKALGTGWKNGTAFNEVEIVNNENGKPELQLLGKTAITIGVMKIHVSLSHVKNMATAVVVAEQ